jgi:predicted Zn-dependent protease
MVVALPALAELQQLRPGFNLFSPQQDVQLGQEAAREVPKQMTVLRNRDLDAYLDVLLRKLEKSRYARTLNRDGSRSELFPFSIHAVYDKKINAFSLPGGPLFVNTGAIDAADNEAQLAGVIAHEMSHVVLRHMTNQASKRELVALPAVLAGAVAGHSLLGQLAQLGVVFTANSALLKFSRTDEAEADYNGAEMMADAGYNPIEMARFFEKLEDKAGRGGAIEQFLSDHPNPGNRIAAISDEVREMPRRNYVDDETGQLGHVREVVRKITSARGCCFCSWRFAEQGAVDV